MKKFAYYKTLTERQRRLYDRSDAVTAVRIPGARELGPLAAAVSKALEGDDRPGLERAAQRLVTDLLAGLQVTAVRVRVLPVRPSNHREELHGQYEFGGRRVQPTITVWMRTAQKQKVVASKTFLRTLLHEVAHHLDYQLYHFEDSLHTQGFYKRAESLFDQILPVERKEPAAAAPAAGAVAAPRRPAAPSPARAAAAQRPATAPPPKRAARPRPRATQAPLPFGD